MKTEHATPELFTAISQAQGEIENAGKTSSNPHFKSKYADLAEILNTVRPVFSKFGLSLIQSTEFDGSLVSVTTLIAHQGGGYITAVASCVPAKTDAQGVGAATTYLRRYAAAAVSGIAQEDDDGNAAAHNGKPAPQAVVTEADKIKADEFKQAMKDADTETVLIDLGKQLASSKFPASIKETLRAVYSQRLHELKVQDVAA